MLVLKNIKKSYSTGDSKQLVLKGVTISFRKNEFASILGSSGSGKSTLLNIIGALDSYDEGDLIIDNQSTKNFKDCDFDSYRNHHVGFIFQRYNLIPHLSLLKNVELALTLQNVSSKIKKQKAIDALTKVGLQEHIYKKPNQLSGGQMQRVAIARAIVNDPDILLADEPTGALDSNTSIQIMDLLKLIAKDKLVIMVTHNPELAKIYSTRIIELKDGNIISDSNPYNKEETQIIQRKIPKISLSKLTALELSFNNLLTKKSRTIMTCVATSIGIIGIAIILSLSNGLTKYISSFAKNSTFDAPISVEKYSYDFSKLLDSSNIKADSDEIVSYNDSILGNIELIENNLTDLQSIIENNDEYIEYVKYNYDIQMNFYYNNTLLNNNDQTPIFDELLNTNIMENEYKLLTGKLPTDENELLLVLNKEHTIKDSLLQLLELKEKDDHTTKALDINTFMNIPFHIVVNTDLYEPYENHYIDISYDNDKLTQVIQNSKSLKIVGVVESNTTNSFIGYTSDLKNYIIDRVCKSPIYSKQINNPNINIITNTPFDHVIDTYENNCKLLGIANKETPSTIYIYAKNYNSKKALIETLDNFNNTNKNQIVYTDMMDTMVSAISSIINSISMVLIGFVTISLVVSSIMIAIITYISVLERTKEIGILRALGTSRKDISFLFKAETMIEGFISGILGIGFTVLINIPINLIIENMTDISHMSSLSFAHALILILLSIIISTLSGSMPSKKAAKKEIVSCLQSD